MNWPGKALASRQGKKRAAPGCGLPRCGLEAPERAPRRPRRRGPHGPPLPSRARQPETRPPTSPPSPRRPSQKPACMHPRPSSGLPITEPSTIETRCNDREAIRPARAHNGRPALCLARARFVRRRGQASALPAGPGQQAGTPALAKAAAIIVLAPPPALAHSLLGSLALVEMRDFIMPYSVGVELAVRGEGEG